MIDNMSFGSAIREMRNYTYSFKTWREIFIEKPIKESKEFNMELKING